MTKIPLDSLERERIAALAAYKILDTQPEAEFDDIVRLASILCQTSMSAISLVDERRQWFKASVGLTMRETPREIAFCSHIVNTRDEMIVEDASLSPLFSDNPLVTGNPNIRFFAGVPLLSEKGLVMGSVCVIDQVPRTLQPHQMEALRILARQASILLDRRIKQQELFKKTWESSEREAEVLRLSAKQNELAQTLAVSEERYRVLFEEHPQPLWVHRTDTLAFVAVNDAAVRLYGYTKEEFLSMRVSTLWPDSEALGHGSIMRSPNSAAMQSVRTFITKAGTTVFAELTAKPIAFGDYPAKLVITVDVTERQNLRSRSAAAGQKIRESLERLEFALDSAQIGEWHIDYVTGEEYHSKWHDYCYGFSYQAFEWSFESFLSRVHTGDRGRVTETLSAARLSGKNYDMEYRVVWPDSTVHWLRALGRFEIDERGKPLQMTCLVRDVTSTVLAAQRTALYERAIEAANTGVIIVDGQQADQPIIYANPAFQRITGYIKEEIIGRNCRILQGKLTSRARVAALRQAIAQRLPFQVELDNYRKDGTVFCNHLYVSPVFNGDGELTNYVGIQHDVTALKTAQQSAAARAKQQEALAGFGLFVLAGHTIAEIYSAAVYCVAETLEVEYAKLLSPVPDGNDFIVAASYGWGQKLLSGKIIPGNRRSYARSAFEADAPILIENLTVDPTVDLEDVLESTGVTSAISTVIRIGSHRFGTLTAFAKAPSRFNSGDIAFIQGMANILATALERAKNESQLAYLAHHDTLTGLPNRTQMNDRLAGAIARASRTGESIALMFIDLNRFKLINDSLGHHVGDDLLKAVARRLSACLPSGVTLFRQGGDEYMLLMENEAGPDSCTLVAEKILGALQTPFFVTERTFHISCSIGIALCPDDAANAEELLRLADAAMYRAKELHAGGGYQFFTPEISAFAKDRWTLEQGLRSAIANRELRLVYQPKLDLRTGAVTAVEALLRWKQGQHAEISPARFIPVAEATGLIMPIGEWVFRQSCIQARRWHGLGYDVEVAVNMAARQFHERGLVESIRRILAETECRAEWINVEVTETGIMRDAEQVVRQLHELKKVGISISVDDFGTGYSSLSYLKRFDVDILKIDRSFVKDITADSESAAIASSIITLAHSLQLRVVAEGVETSEQLELLRNLGCDLVQGYLIARPMEVPDCTEFLKLRS